MASSTSRRATSSTRTWSEFKRWCASRGLKSLPAHAWTIAAYLRLVDRRAKHGTGAEAARQALDVIAREHLLKTARVPTRHPTVQKTLELIERRAHIRSQHAALFDEADILAAPAPPGAEEEASEEDAPADEAEGASRTRRVLSTQPRLKRAKPARKRPVREP